VISRQMDYAAPGADVAESLEKALQLASTAKTVFIIGGEQIYALALPLADRLEITEVDLAPEGDAWFPEISTVDWQESAKKPGQSSNPGCTFVTYLRQRAG